MRLGFYIFLIILMVGCNPNKRIVKSAHGTSEPKTASASDTLADITTNDTITLGSVIGEGTGTGQGYGSGSVVSNPRVVITRTHHVINHRPAPSTVPSIAPSNSSETSSRKLLYQIPDSMKLGKVSEVYVRISRYKNSVSIEEGLSSSVRTRTITTTETMEVELIDPSGNSFSIRPNNKAKQIVENDTTYTEWRWDVTPVKSGQKSLKIIVSVIKEGNTKQTVYVDTVAVKSNAVYVTKGFFEKYWQWLCSTIIIPFIIWLWKSRKKEE